MKDSPTAIPHSRLEIISAFADKTLSSQKESRSTVEVGAQLLGIEESKFDEMLDKYFVFIQSKIPEIKEESRSNFKKNLWMLFIERENILVFKGKQWTMENIESSGYLKSMLQGFCFIMDELIKVDGNLKSILDSKLILELHRLVTKDAANERGESLEKISGQYGLLGTRSASSNHNLSLNYLLETLQMRPDQKAFANVNQEIQNSSCILSYPNAILQNAGSKNGEFKLEVCHARKIPNSFVETDSGKLFMARRFSALIDKSVSRLMEGETTYQQFAWKMLNYHPFADGNGRIFNHLLCFAYAVSKETLPYMMWHAKSHESITEQEWKLMVEEGQEAFREIFLGDESLSHYIEHNSTFANFMYHVVDPASDFLKSEEFKSIISNREGSNFLSMGPNKELTIGEIIKFQQKQPKDRLEFIESQSSQPPFRGVIETVIFDESTAQILANLNKMVKEINKMKDEKLKAVVKKELQENFGLSEDLEFNEDNAVGVYTKLETIQKNIQLQYAKKKHKPQFNIVDLYCKIANEEPLIMMEAYYYKDQKVELPLTESLMQTRLHPSSSTSPQAISMVNAQMQGNKCMPCVIL